MTQLDPKVQELLDAVDAVINYTNSFYGSDGDVFLKLKSAHEALSPKPDKVPVLPAQEPDWWQDFLLPISAVVPSNYTIQSRGLWNRLVELTSIDAPEPKPLPFNVPEWEDAPEQDHSDE